MALKEIIIPKRYKNGKVLFENNLDQWRLAVVSALQDVQLNLTQLRKDSFFPSYNYDNDGNANLGQSLQTQINLLAGGGSPLSGTSSSQFTINTGANAATLDTVLLTGSRNIYFPDSDGTLVYQDFAQTLTNKTLTNPTINAAVLSGNFSGSGGFVNITASDLIIASTKKFRLDGNSSGDTYIYESSSNIVDFYAGNENFLKATASTRLLQVANANWNFALSSTGKLFFDGGGDTYIHEGTANVLNIVIGTTGTAAFTTTKFVLGSALDFQMDPTKKLFLDGGGNTYIFEDSADSVSHVSGGNTSLKVTTSTVQILTDGFLSATKKLFLDGGGDTYIYESAANVVDFYSGNENFLKATTSTRLLQVANANWNFAVPTTGKVYLDGGSDTYIFESSANTMDLVTAGSTAMRIASSGSVNINQVVVGSTIDVNTLTINTARPTTTGVAHAIKFDDLNGSTGAKRAFSFANTGFYNATALGTYRGAFLINVGGVERRVPFYD